MKVIRWLDKYFEETIMMTLLAIMSIVMFVQVILRYFFGNALPWAEELCRFMFIWFACMGFATGVKHHEDLRVDTLYEKVPRKWQILMDVITTICMFVFCLTIGYGGIAIMQQQIKLGTLSSALKLPMSFVYGALAFGLLFMLLRMIQTLIQKKRL